MARVPIGFLARGLLSAGATERVVADIEQWLAGIVARAAERDHRQGAISLPHSAGFQRWRLPWSQSGPTPSTQPLVNGDSCGWPPVLVAEMAGSYRQVFMESSAISEYNEALMSRLAKTPFSFRGRITASGCYHLAPLHA